MSYEAPVDDIMLALKTAGNLGELSEKGIYPGLDEDTIRSVIEEAGKFGAEVLAPLNTIGDKEACTLSNGVVTMPHGFKDAYKQFADAGWSALPCPEAYGGQGLPEIMSVVAAEIWNAANLSFGLCPLLTQGAIHAIEAGGSETIKATYLPKMISGAWTGTMNLTEPHAGSDLSVINTKAVRNGGGTYLITGTKIFITFGEHDMAENIIHLVLARLTDAPAGTRGISLFVVPKFLLNTDGSPGVRNDVICAGIEHKLGINASPTCVMKYGENGGAIGYLVGEENRGLATMFVMMNAARLAVGMQGVAVAERATQRAIAFAKGRTQGHAAGSASAGLSAIIEHPNVRRKLMTMKAMTQAARHICIATASSLDISHRASDAGEKAAAANRAALLTPVAKAFATDMGVEVASLGIQVHGGMGFVEETGAAQYYRDARILPIYEGTNGIQAIDLVTRKLPLQGGATIKSFLAELDAISESVRGANRGDLGASAVRLASGLAALKEATHWIAGVSQTDQNSALASASPYLRLFGLAAGGAFLAKAALTTQTGSAQAAVARYYAENYLTGAEGLAQTVMTGSDAVVRADRQDVFA